MSRIVVVPAVTRSEISVPSFVVEKTPQLSADENNAETISFVSFEDFSSSWRAFCISSIVKESLVFFSFV